MATLGKTLIVMGLVLCLVGVLAWALSGVKGLPFGRLPGDIRVEREGFSFFAPLTSMIMLSIVASLVFWLISRAAR